MVWKYMTAGESHGPAVTGYLEGMPAGLALGPGDVDPDLARRQVGYGRGARMAIERDTVEFIGGIRPEEGMTELGGAILFAKEFYRSCVSCFGLSC